MAPGDTVKLPVNETEPTTLTDTLEGCPVVPDCTETPERLVTRSEYEVIVSGLTSSEPLFAIPTLPVPSLMIAVVAPVNDALIAAVVPAVIVVEAPPATVKLVITGFALSTCRVPVAEATVPSPAVRVAVRSRSPSASVAVSTSNA